MGCVEYLLPRLVRAGAAVSSEQQRQYESIRFSLSVKFGRDIFPNSGRRGARSTRGGVSVFVSVF